jgi:hypothetical protein
MIAEIAIAEPLPRWAVMWLLAGGVFLAGKLAMRAALGRVQPAPTGWDEVAWLALWPGMDAEAFFRRGAAPVRTVADGSGLTAVLLGLGLIWGGARHLESPLAAGWVAMVGLVLVLHFGLFRLLAGCWQRQGRRVRPIMDRPALSLSLAEFWGQRWNRAFRDLAHRWIFRPVLRRRGRHAATAAVFLASGLVHELVITVPAGAGYGLPLIYFLIQALGMTLERRLFPGSAAVAGPGHLLPRWIYTHVFTLGPAFILFPPPFVERVILPFLHFIHALP